MSRPITRCELCGREASTTFHHLIPRTLHSKKRFKKAYTPAQLQEGLYLCKLCHDGIHELIPSERELGEKYNTRERLLHHEAVRKHVAWARRQSRQQ